MLSDGDNYILSKFRDQNMNTRTDMLEKKVLTCYDSNSGGYNGELIFDVSSLGVASDWLDYGSAFITIPFVCTLKSNGTASIGNSFNKTSVQIKDGHHHLIDAISIEVNGRTIQSIQNFSNMFYHMKYVMSSSAEDVLKNSGTTGVFGENVTRLGYNGSAHYTGIGYSPIGDEDNWSDKLAASRAHSSLNMDPTADATDLPWIDTNEMITSSAQNYFISSGATTTVVNTWVFYYIVQLRHISSFFENLPLTKSTDIKLIIKYNSFSANINVQDDEKMSITSYIQLSGHSCPVILCATSGTVAVSGSCSFNGNIASSGLGEATGFVLANKQCRLYVPSYKIRPDVASAMISSFPQTKCDYLDIYSYSVTGIASKNSFVQNITNGVTDPVFVMVLPFQNDIALRNLIKGSQYQSVFDSAPATTSGVFLKDFQVQVAGKNTFQMNESYSYDQFINEFSKFFAIAGNSLLGTTSGIISQQGWNKAYRCYVADVSRREPSEDNVSKSIVLSGYNSSSKDIELICFVAYRKKIVINTATGILSD